LTFGGPNTKARFTSCKQSTEYGNKQFPCENAYGGKGKHYKFSHTKGGAKGWWEGSWGNQYFLVTEVKILNRKDCCGDRLASSKVEVDGELCGTLPASTQNGKWYTVKC